MICETEKTQNVSHEHLKYEQLELTFTDTRSLRFIYFSHDGLQSSKFAQ